MKGVRLKLISCFALFLILMSLLSCEVEPEPTGVAAAQLLNEHYGSDSKQTMDVYLPAGRSSDQTPLLVYIHGGGWMGGDKNEFLQIKPILEQEFPGYAFVTLNYRLYDFEKGKHGISDQEQDVISAFDYIESQASIWHISDNIVLIGSSAGGHLALLHAYKNTTSDLKSVVAFFPPTDLAAFHQFNTATALGLDALLGGTPAMAPSSYRDASPVNFVDELDVPTIFFHGALDQVVPVSQSELLEDALVAAGVRHQFKLVAGQGHGLTFATYRESFHQAKIFIGEF